MNFLTNTHISILICDKDSVVFVICKAHYVNIRLHHLNNSGRYNNIDKDPLKKVLKEVSNTIKSKHSLRKLSKKLVESNPLTPKFYSLLKIHKEGAPLRPIVNTIGGPTYVLTKNLAQVLKPLVRLTNSFVKHFYSHVSEINNIKVDPSHILVSFIAISMFMNIHINESIDIIVS